MIKHLRPDPKHGIHLLAICISMIVFAGFCFAGSGKTSKGVYTSPLKNFSVKIPGGLGMRVQEQGDKNGGIVSFHDDFGTLKSVFYLRLSPETLSIQNDPTKQRASLERFLSSYAIPYVYKPNVPDASVLHTEHIDEITPGGENSYFAIINLPGGSTMFDAKHNRGYDTRRGVLIFVRGAFIYMLSSGENPDVLHLGNPDVSVQTLAESEKEQLKTFRTTITFPK